MKELYYYHLFILILTICIYYILIIIITMSLQLHEPIEWSSLGLVRQNALFTPVINIKFATCSIF